MKAPQLSAVNVFAFLLYHSRHSTLCKSCPWHNISFFWQIRLVHDCIIVLLAAFILILHVTLFPVYSCVFLLTCCEPSNKTCLFLLRRGAYRRLCLKSAVWGKRTGGGNHDGGRSRGGSRGGRGCKNRDKYTTKGVASDAAAHENWLQQAWRLSDYREKTRYLGTEL